MSAVASGAVGTRARHILRLIPLLLLAMFATACTPTAAAEVSADTVVIDVRTPEEFAAGHLEGAVNIDVSASDFAARAAELDPDGDYIVYCRSGNRSAHAARHLESIGFTSVHDAGGLQGASSSTGIPIVP